jgi:hypothetical protein
LHHVLVNEGHLKVRFELQRASDGWPPADFEGLWATPVGEDLVRLDNTPFFLFGVAAEDIIRVRPDAHGGLWAVQRVQWSGNCTIRVLPLREGPLAGNFQAVREAFSPFGTDSEISSDHSLVALNVPPTADLPAVKALLHQGEQAGWWAYEEACVGPTWTAINPAS